MQNSGLNERDAIWMHILMSLSRFGGWPPKSA
jgi:hypothetical protein